MDQRNEALAETLQQLHKSFIEAHRALSVSAERLLNIIALCNTAASEARAGKRLKGVYIRRDYVYVSFGQVLLA
jgi:hypothetical protein